MKERRILLVDDEPDIRQIAAMALQLGSGWTVLTASSGAQALEVAGREVPDAILLDVMMPGMDGPETLRRLREDAALRETPVLFLTAKAQPDRAAARTVLGRVAQQVLQHLFQRPLVTLDDQWLGLTFDL